jgi:hypothetical protein
VLEIYINVTYLESRILQLLFFGASHLIFHSQKSLVFLNFTDKQLLFPQR